MYHHSRHKYLLAKRINSPDWSIVVKKPKFEAVTVVDGYKVILTDHAKQQCLKRHNVSLENLTVMFKDMTGSLNSIPVKEYNQEVFLYSAKYQRGCVCAFRRDFKSDSKALALVVMTVYPYGKAVPVHKDTEVYYV